MASRAPRRRPSTGLHVSARTLPVPDGLDGMRVDAGLARLLGLSRTVVADLAESGEVLLDGRAAGKSDRLTAGAWLEVTLPEPAAPIAVAAVPVDGPRRAVPGRRHRRRRQAGRRGRASQPRLDRPDRHRRPGRRRHHDRHLRRGRTPGRRAPAGRRHDRRDGGGQERTRVLGAQARLQGTHGRQALPRGRAGPARSRAVAPSTRRSTGIPSTTTSSPSSRAGVPASRTTRWSRRSRTRRCST